MKHKGFWKKALDFVSHFFIFLTLIVFVITVCLMLFLRVMQKTTGAVFTAAEISDAAKGTMLCVLLITVLFTVIDSLRRRLTVERPIAEITAAAEKMCAGDFDVQIKPALRFASDGQFNRIIDCINQMARELSGVETLRSDFVANVSHEMKTPLSTMQNYATLLQMPNLTAEDRVVYAKAVEDAAARLSDMVTNILKLNRLENQQILPQAVRFDLAEQLCECLLQYEAVWEEKEISLDTALCEGVTVCADRELLALVWNNLFSNAFKFTDCGGKVSLTMAVEDSCAVVRITDTGCGISPEVGAHIFEKFYQGDSSHAVQGNGLGLALVKKAVDILQAEISVESTVGVGTTFTVRIGREDNGIQEHKEYEEYEEYKECEGYNQNEWEENR